MLAWEAERLPRAAAKIGLPVPSGELARQRADFADSKHALGADEIRRRLRRDLRLGDIVANTTGGSPLPTRFLVDYTDLSTLTTSSDPASDADAAGVAISGKGLHIGGVRHEFRDVPGGFHARLCVEFPRTTLPRILSEHRRHLAIEFSNWVEFAFGAGR
ncbi:hypothetical protein [Streptomyces sp. NPDC001091]